MTAGTFVRRDQERIQTLISWAFHLHCLPLQRKYLPETPSQEAEAYTGEKRHSSATLLTVMAVSKVLPSTKETNPLRHLSWAEQTPWSSLRALLKMDMNVKF